MKKNATNSTHMKLHNRRLILQHIRREPVSRAELARRTGLTRAAVTLLVEELVGEGLIVETVRAEAEYGRKPVLLDLNPDRYYTLGVYLTRNGCRMGIVDLKGSLVAERSLPPLIACDRAHYVERMKNEIQRMVRESGDSYDRLLGIGISSPGPVDTGTGTILNPPNFDLWHHVKIAEELGSSFALPAFLENNSISLALAEKNYGAGSDFDSFMLMVVDTGIGGGLVIHDKMYRGVGGFGSEIGHTSVNIDGEPCSCGNLGCLEVYASIPAILKHVQLRDKTVTSWKMIVDRAVSGDEHCWNAVDREARYLSAGITNSMNLLELEAVILAGDVTYRPELLLDRIRHYVGKWAISRNTRSLRIMISSIPQNAEVISAASTIIEKLFEGDLCPPVIDVKL